MQRQNLSLHSSAFHHIYEIKSANKFFNRIVNTFYL